MDAMFELHVQKTKDSAVNVYEVFAASFEAACEKYIEKRGAPYKITNPNIYNGVI